MDKLVKGLTVIVAGGIAVKTVKEYKRRKYMKEAYEKQQLEAANEQ